MESAIVAYLGTPGPVGLLRRSGWLVPATRFTLRKEGVLETGPDLDDVEITFADEDPVVVVDGQIAQDLGELTSGELARSTCACGVFGEPFLGRVHRSAGPGRRPSP